MSKYFTIISIIFISLSVSAQENKSIFTKIEEVVLLNDSAINAYKNRDWVTVTTLYQTIGALDQQFLDNNLILAASDSYKQLDKMQESKKAYQLGIAKYGQSVIDEGYGTDIYTIVEQMPEPEGGFEKFKVYLKNNYVYPPSSLEKGLSGSVYLKFIVNKDGSLSGIHSVKGLDQDCNDEAIRLLSEGPKWSPGLQRGKKVYVTQIHSIEFNPKKYRKRVKKNK